MVLLFASCGGMYGHESVEEHATLSLRLMLYNKLCKRCVQFTWKEDVVLPALASNILCELFEYLRKVVIQQAILEPIKDSRLLNNYVKDFVVLWRHVVLTIIGAT